MTRVLVTGGSGFIGTNIVEHYRRRGDDVANFDTVPPRCAAHAECWRRMDVLDSAALSEAINSFAPEIAFHMAARTDLAGTSIDDYAENVVGVGNVVNALSTDPQLRLAVFASSMLVCQAGYVPKTVDDYCPSTVYGESKVLGERIVRAMPKHALRWIIVRPTSIWGPWFATPYKDFFDTVRRGRYFHPAGLDLRRSYGFVGNIVHQLARLTEPAGEALIGRTAYLADFEPIKIEDWANHIAREFGRGPVRRLPMPLFRIAARVGDLARALGMPNPPLTTFRLNNMLTSMIYDTEPLRTLCNGTLPYTMPDGVRITCDWLRQHS